MTLSTTTSGRRGLTVGQWIGLAIGLAGFLFPLVTTIDGLTPAGHRMLAIFLLAVALWVAEVVPLHATAVLIILLEVLLISDKGFFAATDGFTPVKYGTIFAALADPVIILFLGGFFLADGATKYQLDRNLARVILRPFGSRPAMILMGLMLITAVFSMFMSNTATTATFMAVVMPVIGQLPREDRFRTALALSIPIAANIGGIGTPIGTPPNAIALGALSKALGGTPITFAQWMLGAMPFVIVFLAIAYVLLITLYRPSAEAIPVNVASTFDRRPKAVVFYVTFAATVLLWMTENLHGINSNVIGFVPVVVLTCTGVFGVDDIQKLEWHVLWLVAGGIALGTGIAATGMDQWFIDLFPWGRMGPFVLVAVLMLAALVMSEFLSNSATCNLLAPIGISLAMSGVVNVSPVEAAVFIAIGTSLAMALPISTPPNAIAFATGQVRVKDMAIVGTLFGVLGWAIFVTVGPWVWTSLGILPR